MFRSVKGGQTQKSVGIQNFSCPAIPIPPNYSELWLPQLEKRSLDFTPNAINSKDKDVNLALIDLLSLFWNDRKTQQTTLFKAGLKFKKSIGLSSRKLIMRENHYSITYLVYFAHGVNIRVTQRYWIPACDWGFSPFVLIFVRCEKNHCNERKPAYGNCALPYCSIIMKLCISNFLAKS